MESLGFELREEASLNMLTSDVIKSSAIEGEKLNLEEICSSIARQPGIDQGGYVPSSRHVDGIVEMLLDATQNSTNSHSPNNAYMAMWFLGCLERALLSAEDALHSVLFKSEVWQRLQAYPVNERQRVRFV